jgi:GNAT superfamily N-acetyltransferase
MPSLEQPAGITRWSDVRRLLEEYAASLPVDLAFQDFAGELARLESEYGPPGGAMLLAVDNGIAVGCVGLRRWSERTGEIKRLYVAPAARGRGLGRTLAEAIVALAAQLGYTRLVLDTLPSMQSAQALYLSLGFKPIEAYRFNPVPGTAYLELTLE